MATARVLQFYVDAEETTSPAPVEETTHEEFVHAVRDAVVGRLDAGTRERLLATKLVYGGGSGQWRGICYHSAWQNGSTHDFVEIAATGEESHVQLAGTTVHELGHVLAGPGCGHGPEWKKACAVLGLKVAQAAGQDYSAAHFDASVWATIETLPHPSDGKPAFAHVGGPALRRKPRPCSQGIGTRGGRSRGAGSGSRLRLWVCRCPDGTPGRKVRVASDEWDATCNRCGERYRRG